MTQDNSPRSFLFRTAATLILRGFGAISGLIFSYAVTRTLSVDDAGVFFLGVAIITVLWSVSSLGMPLALVRFIGVFHSEADYPAITGVLRVATTRVLVVACVIALGLFLASGEVAKALNWPPSGRAMLAVMSFAIPIIAVSNLIAFAFQGIHRTLTSIILQHLVTPLGSSAILGLLVLWSYSIGLLTVAFAMVLAAVICLLFALLLWFSRSTRRSPGILARKTEFLRAAGPIYASSLMGLLVTWSSILIAGLMLSASDVAYLTISQRLAMLTSFVLIATNLVVAPRFAASYANGDMERLRKTSLFGSRLMLATAVPVLSIMIVFPELLLGVFGEQYIVGARLLQILAVGQFVNVATGSVGFLLNMTGHEKDMRNVTVVAGSLSIVLAVILTSKFGVIGSAVAASIASASQNLFAAYFVRLRLGISIWKIF